MSPLFWHPLLETYNAPELYLHTVQVRFFIVGMLELVSAKSNTLFGSTGSGNFLAKKTATLATLFFVIRLMHNNPDLVANSFWAGVNATKYSFFYKLKELLTLFSQGPNLFNFTAIVNIEDFEKFEYTAILVRYMQIARYIKAKFDNIQQLLFGSNFSQPSENNILGFYRADSVESHRWDMHRIIIGTRNFRLFRITATRFDFISTDSLSNHR